jgi:hypothetical protein
MHATRAVLPSVEMQGGTRVQVKLWEVQEGDEATAVGAGEADMQRLVRGNQEYMNAQRMMVPMPADEDFESFMRNPEVLRLIGMTRLRYGTGDHGHAEVTCRQS